MTQTQHDRANRRLLHRIGFVSIIAVMVGMVLICMAACGPTPEQRFINCLQSWIDGNTAAICTPPSAGT